VTTQKKAAIYASVHHEGATRSLTLAYQVAEGKKYCWSYGLRLDDTNIYQEVSAGEEYTNRPVLTRLREAARNKAFDVVVVSDFDQLGTPQQQVLFLAEMESCGISVESIRGPFIGDIEMQRFVNDVQTAREQMERDQRAKRRKQPRQQG
jgi:hypothetical protein